MYEVWTQFSRFLGSQLHPLTTNFVVILALVFLIAVVATETRSNRHGG